MRSIVRITIFSLLFSVVYQPVSASSSRNNSIDAANEDRGICIGRPSLSLDSSDVYNSISAGRVVNFAGTTASQVWLLCDGQEHFSIDYPELYKAIGIAYVPQDSHIHKLNQRIRSEKLFCVPDLRGRTVVGVDSHANRVTVNNALGASSGEEKHQLTIAEMPSHDHSLNQKMALGSGVHPIEPFILHGSTKIEGKILNTANVGNNQSHNNMQPYLVLNYIIKTGQEEADSQPNRTAQRDTELDDQRRKIDQLEQKLSTLETASAKAWVVFNGMSATV